MQQICNLVYSLLTDGKTAAQIAEFDVLLTEPRQKSEMIERQNAEAMKALGDTGMLIAPPRKKPAKRPPKAKD